MRVRGHDGLAMRVPVRPKAPTNSLRAYFRGWAIVFVGLGFYAAWLHSAAALLCCVASAVALWIGSNVRRYW